ncbi:hypothetical protein SNEBB_006404 [Seison nebaliae]|nr:hypothetical protein SNEBB_006404 [Seison nebaliae]
MLMSRLLVRRIKAPARLFHNYSDRLITHKTDNEKQLKELNGQHLRHVEEMESYLKSIQSLPRRTGANENELKDFGPVVKKGFKEIGSHKADFPYVTDYLIVGGGAIGLSTAYHLAKQFGNSEKVVVIEQDPMYVKNSSALSCGGIRTQFSLEENIRMSLYSVDFLRNVHEHLAVDFTDRPDVNFQEHGYLTLATTEGAETLLNNYRLQIRENASVQLLNGRQLREKFPYMNFDGIEVGCLGLANEGWFDPWSLITSLKKKCLQMGIIFVKGEVIDFEMRMIHSATYSNEGASLNQALVRCDDNQVRPLHFGMVVNAAGSNAGRIAQMAGIGCHWPSRTSVIEGEKDSIGPSLGIVNRGVMTKECGEKVILHSPHTVGALLSNISWKDIAEKMEKHLNDGGKLLPRRQPTKSKINRANWKHFPYQMQNELPTKLKEDLKTDSYNINAKNELIEQFSKVVEYEDPKVNEVELQKFEISFQLEPSEYHKKNASQINPQSEQRQWLIEKECVEQLDLDLNDMESIVERYPWLLPVDEVAMTLCEENPEKLSQIEPLDDVYSLLTDGFDTRLTITHPKYLPALEAGLIRPRSRPGIRISAYDGTSGDFGFYNQTQRTLLSTPLPVIPTKRYVFCIHTRKPLPLNMPMLIDHTGFYIRREGLSGNYICGMSPTKEQGEPNAKNYDVDYDFFLQEVWPRLATRIPSLEECKLTNAWAGMYDYNYFDENLIIGTHPVIPQMMFVNGSSGHGIQHAPAIGRAAAELLLHRYYMTIELERMSFERVIDLNPLGEKNII